MPLGRCFNKKIRYREYRIRRDDRDADNDRHYQVVLHNLAISSASCFSILHLHKQTRTQASQREGDGDSDHTKAFLFGTPESPHGFLLSAQRQKRMKAGREALPLLPFHNPSNKTWQLLKELLKSYTLPVQDKKETEGERKRMDKKLLFLSSEFFCF